MEVSFSAKIYMHLLGTFKTGTITGHAPSTLLLIHLIQILNFIETFSKDMLYTHLLYSNPIH
jgi:hypothetical protein